MIQVAEKIWNGITAGLSQHKVVISLQGSSRSAKTYNTLIWLIIYLLNNPNTRLSIVRKTLPALRGSVLVDFKEIMIRMKLWNNNSFNKTELIYHFPNGSWVEFFSTDDEQKIRGRKRNILFVNEANEISQIEWQQLVMRTTHFTILDYNPSFSDDHWICQVNKEDKTFHFISTYKDNPFLEQVIVNEIESLQRKNESLWRIYGLGQQAQVEGLIFKNVDIIEKMPFSKRIYTGMDFGFSNDPTAIVDVSVAPETLYVDEICYRTEMVSKDIIQVLKTHCPDRKVISESADPRLIKEIHNAGINIHPVEKYQGSIEAGINKMLEYKICLTKNSYNTIKEFKNYTYQQDKDGKWLNKPIDQFNHSIDAIRYVVLTEVLGRNRKPTNLRRLTEAAY
jgi:phage terminase large subunit